MSLWIPSRAFGQSLPPGMEINRSSVQAHNLIHAWLMNEGGLRSYNGVSPGRDITWTSTVNGGRDRMVVPQFDGTASRGEVAIDLSTYAAISVSWWMYWNAYATDNDMCLELTPNTNTTDGGFYVDPNHSSGNLAVQTHGTGSLTNRRTIPRPSAAAWHHYFLVMDKALATAEINAFYVDGAAQTLTDDSTDTNMADNFANNSLYIMHRNNGGSRTFFGAGRMSDLRVYKAAMTPSAALRCFTNPFDLWRRPAIVLGNAKPSAPTVPFTGTVIAGKFGSTGAGVSKTRLIGGV